VGAVLLLLHEVLKMRCAVELLKYILQTHQTAGAIFLICTRVTLSEGAAGGHQRYYTATWIGTCCCSTLVHLLVQRQLVNPLYLLYVTLPT